MVCIVVVEATEDNFLFIRFIVAVGISEQNEISALRYVNTFRCKLNTYRDVKAVSKGRLFVCFVVAIGIFQDNDFIIWLRIARLPMWIGRHGGYP